MIKKTLLTFLIVIIFLISNVYPKIGITNYPNISVGINTNQNNKIFGELKVFTNNNISEELPFELSIFRNIKKQDRYSIYLGLGLNVSPFRGFDQINSFKIPIGFQIIPIKNFSKFSLITEISPSIYEGSVYIQQLWGFRYNF